MFLGSLFIKEKGNSPKGLKGEKLNEDYVPYLTINVINGDVSKYTSKHEGVLADKDDILVVADGSGSGRIYRGFEGLVLSTF